MDTMKLHSLLIYQGKYSRHSYPQGTVLFCLIMHVKSKLDPWAMDACVLHHTRVDHRPSGQARQQLCPRQTVQASHL